MAVSELLFRYDSPKNLRERNILLMALKAKLEEMEWTARDFELSIHIHSNRERPSTGGIIWGKFYRIFKSAYPELFGHHVQCGGCWTTRADGESPYIRIWLKEGKDVKHGN